MRLLAVLTCLYLFPACSRSDAGEVKRDIASFKKQRDIICQEFDASKIDRCDRSTFHVLMNAACGFPIPTQYEYPSGKWNRDVEPCWPNDSRSETSRDTYLSVIMSHDEEAIKRVIAYAKPQGWETGLPEGGVGEIRVLIPLLRIYLAGPLDDALDAIKSAFSGHRGHLIAGYMWEHALQTDGLTLAESELLGIIHRETPNSPYLSCLYHRFSHTDTNQDDTLKQLGEIGHRNFGWGGSNFAIHFALTLRCLEGL